MKLDHPNIVKVYELYINEKEGHIYSIMELINSSEMFEVIKRYGSYSGFLLKYLLENVKTFPKRKLLAKFSSKFYWPSSICIQGGVVIEILSLITSFAMKMDLK